MNDGAKEFSQNLTQGPNPFRWFYVFVYVVFFGVAGFSFYLFLQQNILADSLEKIEIGITDTQKKIENIKAAAKNLQSVDNAQKIIPSLEHKTKWALILVRIYDLERSIGGSDREIFFEHIQILPEGIINISGTAQGNDDLYRLLKETEGNTTESPSPIFFGGNISSIEYGEEIRFNFSIFYQL